MDLCAYSTCGSAHDTSPSAQNLTSGRLIWAHTSHLDMGCSDIRSGADKLCFVIEAHVKNRKYWAFSQLYVALVYAFKIEFSDKLDSGNGTQVRFWVGKGISRLFSWGSTSGRMSGRNFATLKWKIKNLVGYFRSIRDHHAIRHVQNDWLID